MYVPILYLFYTTDSRAQDCVKISEIPGTFHNNKPKEVLEI